MLTIRQQAEHHAAEQGVILTPDDLIAIEALQAARFGQDLAAPSGLVETFNHHFPRLIDALHSVGDAALAVIRTVIVSLFVPVILLLLIEVEIGRVSLGVSLFEPNVSTALFAATSLVLLNLTVELIIDYTETRAGYREERARRWSLRLFAGNMAYRIGIGRAWQAAELSPAQRYRQLRTIVTFAILTLALAGSMRVAIDGTSGTWYQALMQIVTQSSLSLASTWLSGVIFAVAAVVSAQGLSRYVSVRTVEVLTAMTARTAQAVQDKAAEHDRIAAQYIEARTAQAANERRAAQPMQNMHIIAAPIPASASQITAPDEVMIRPILPVQANGHSLNGFNTNGHSHANEGN